MMKQLEKYLMPLAEKIGRNKYLISIRDGFLVSTPLLIAGSIFLLIANFPIAAWTKFLDQQLSIRKQVSHLLHSYQSHLMQHSLSWQYLR